MADEAPAPVPGDSPYCVKGGIYLGTVKFFTHEVPGGLQALHDQIDDPRLLAFIQQPFLASCWYDVLPVAALIRAEARAVKMTVPTYLRLRTTFQAKEDINGVYRFLLKLFSPEKVGMRLPRLLTQIFNHGTNAARLVEPGWIEATLYGYPKILWEWYSTAFEVYAETALRLAGARKATALLRAPEDERIERGVALMRVRFDLRWES